MTALLWEENIAESTNGDDTKPSIKDAVEVIRKDPKIMLVGAAQSLFEAAMYVFVLQWPPSITRAIGESYGSTATTPYGTVFSCFMACCLLGSTLFGQLAKMGVSNEESTAGMLTTASLAMGTAAVAAASPAAPLASLVISLFHIRDMRRLLLSFDWNASIEIRTGLASVRHYESFWYSFECVGGQCILGQPAIGCQWRSRCFDGSLDAGCRMHVQATLYG